MVADDKFYIRKTFELALKAAGKTSPNPMVGALIVKNGRIVGQGYHRKAGTPHAEINALKDAGNNANNATLYINLEPCCHTGRTGPCTKAIRDAGIKRVVFSVRDPYTKVNGKGAAWLKKANIEVKSGVLKQDAEKVNEVYFKYAVTGKPFVALKMAQSLDGKIATISGDSKWITGEKSRKFVHRLRSQYDAVIIGAGTARIDNPELTVRMVKGRNPYRILLSTNGIINNKLNLIMNNIDSKTIVATSVDNAKKLFNRRGSNKNLIIWGLKLYKGKISLDDLLEKAAQFGLTSILVEGGSELATAFIKKEMVDKYYIFTAPKMIGDGISGIGSLGIKKMTEIIQLNDFEYSLECRPDMLIIGYPGTHGKRLLR